ncbi:MAG: hypothetical protein IPN42_03540 [Methylococcaceae bacterium]|nr:hypothetical protein [Methylococcaceae bacterium]
MNFKKFTSFFIGLALFAAANSAFALQPSNTTNLVGTWVNVNPTSGGIVKIVVSQNLFTGFTINTFGSCTPTPCNHGIISASRFSDNVSSTVAQGLSGQYNFGFSTMLVTAQRVYDIDGGNFLQLVTQTKFAAGDTRNDYSRTEMFRKQ